MTKRTVTIPAETTEDVYLCDDCGRAADADKAIVYRAVGTEHSDLHYHPACYERVALDPDSLPEPLTFAEFASREVTESSHHVNVKLALGTTDIYLYILGLVFLVFITVEPRLFFFGVVTVGSFILATIRSYSTAQIALEGIYE